MRDFSQVKEGGGGGHGSSGKYATCVGLSYWLPLVLNFYRGYAILSHYSISSNRCRTLLFSTLVSAMSRIHTRFGRFLQPDEAESRRQARDRLHQLRSHRGRLERIFQRNALAGTSIHCPRRKGYSSC